MSPTSTINFGPSDNGLFSPEEITRLMESEYRRARRYDYPLAQLVVEVDRLETLHDLYGVHSRNRIARAVSSLLRSSTRESDVLGTLVDRRLLVLLPHTGREALALIARRLLGGCRELEFRGDGRVLRASLSIGCVTMGDEENLSELTRRAEEALEAALAAGGDRLVEYERLPARSVQLAPGEGGASAGVPAPRPARSPRGAAPRGASPVPSPVPLPGPDELGGETLEEKVRGLLALAAGSTDLGSLEDEVLAILRRTVTETQRERVSRAEVLQGIALQEERVRELKRLLEASEEELALMIKEKSVDPGIASVYRGVQGIDPGEKDYALKRELLSVLYRANLELLHELEDEAGKGGA